MWHGQAIGRLALSISPNEERIQRAAKRVRLDMPEPEEKPHAWTSEWEPALRNQLVYFLAASELSGDQCPAVGVPRFVHGQSQGITDVFGCKVEEQPDGNVFAYPLPADPALVDAVQPAPIETSVYWGAVEWLRCAREATGGNVAFRNPVMTGPMDTANYVLGTTILLEWVYTHPDVVHRLLEKITDVIVRMIGALKDASGGHLSALHFACLRGGPDLCSELRSLLSVELYDEFEAPYLRQIGEAIGPFAAHSCGSWERHIPSVLSDLNFRAMHGQIRENDLAEVCKSIGGRIALAIGPSVNVHSRYTWPDTEAYLRHILNIVPDTQPFFTAITEDELPLWLRLHEELRGK